MLQIMQYDDDDDDENDGDDSGSSFDWSVSNTIMIRNSL